MAELIDDQVVERLVLVRLLAAPASGAKRAQIAKDLAPLIAQRATGEAWAELLNNALAHIEARGLLIRTLKGKSETFALTEAGRWEGLKFLGVPGLPEGMKWAQLRDIYLVARALEYSAFPDSRAKGIATKGGLSAIILKKHYALPLGDTPTMKQAVDALLWKQLGADTDRPFSLDAVKKYLLVRLMEGGQGISTTQLAQQLPVLASGARRNTPSELRLAVLRRWFDHDRTTPRMDAPPDLHLFAERVLAAARTSPTGRFGDRKVFISHAYRAYRERYPEDRVSESTFKERLIEANRAAFLTLTRADLVQAMDPADVSNSEIRYLNATFHFIVVG